ncbi:DUF4435 domain-containing protein [Flavobacterium fluviatile]|uniref:DUF4435 domain-containing protein n=1 Tax=Flavobacterium fluviatile TaxID=1862387 RepID=UPI001AD60FEA|nr:DUF4435 domain-containing protein [Flavobacterium fluviatile]
MGLSVEELRESRMRSVVAYAEFVDSTGKLPNHLFCFFEGKDNPYYVPRIKKYTEDFHPIKCGGRSKVLEVHNLIKNQEVYNNNKKAFFVDRDFNEILSVQDPIVYETPCYSIENLFVSETVFKQILSNEFHLSETTNQLHEKYLNLYKNRQEEFHDAVLLFNAWYACLIWIRNNKGKETGVKLDNKFPKGLINMSIEQILQNYTLEDLKSIFPDATEVALDSLNLKVEEFKNCNKLKCFRGKYEMDFLLKFIDLMISEGKKNNEQIKFSFGGALNNERAISVFTHYAETPDCLDVYINKVINEIV